MKPYSLIVSVEKTDTCIKTVDSLGHSNEWSLELDGDIKVGLKVYPKDYEFIGNESPRE